MRDDAAHGVWSGEKLFALPLCSICEDGGAMHLGDFAASGFAISGVLSQKGHSDGEWYLYPAC
jgi:hypothetical protein